MNLLPLRVIFATYSKSALEIILGIILAILGLNLNKPYKSMITNQHLQSSERLSGSGSEGKIRCHKSNRTDITKGGRNWG